MLCQILIESKFGVVIVVIRWWCFVFGESGSVEYSLISFLYLRTVWNSLDFLQMLAMSSAIAACMSSVVMLVIWLGVRVIFLAGVGRLVNWFWGLA